MITSMRYPPVTKFGKTLLRYLLCAGIPFSRPISVEHEKQSRIRRARFRGFATALGLLVAVYVGVEAVRRRLM